MEPDPAQDQELGNFLSENQSKMNSDLFHSLVELLTHFLNRVIIYFTLIPLNGFI